MDKKTHKLKKTLTDIKEIIYQCKASDPLFHIGIITDNYNKILLMIEEAMNE